MAKIVGTENLSDEEISAALDDGARFVFYQYTISILIMTFRRSSDIYFIRRVESTAFKGLPSTLLTLIFGWWGFPWGPIYSLLSLATNLGGGKDVTDKLLGRVEEG